MRKSGILLPVFSLPSPHGIGTFGKAALRFVDFLKAAGQRYWQILPLHPTGFGDSPYQCFSSFAGNPYFIDLDILCDEGLLLPEEIRAAALGSDTGRIDYGRQYARRFPLLRKAFSRFVPGTAFAAFCAAEEKWLLPYARFMALKTANDGAAWYTWKEKTAAPDEVRFWQFLQYHFFAQWQAVKDYANAAGIDIIGDMPMYVAHDSADVWAAREQFLLDERGLPLLVAGCPPDAFSADGQLWGNPLYDWPRHEAEDFRWWKQRIKHATSIYDVVRIDHFRGIESYWAIPAVNRTARKGEWIQGPGMKLVRAIRENCPDTDFIAEDLGFLTPEVQKLVKESGFPGMKVLEFAFDPREPSNYLPDRYPENCICYTGTHDNETLIQWCEGLDAECDAYAREYLGISAADDLADAIIEAGMQSRAQLFIMQMQDYLRLGKEARMNEPGRLLPSNWRWRMLPGAANDALAAKIAGLTARANRV